MKKDEIKKYIDNCNNSLEGFTLSPLKKIEDCILFLDSFQEYLTKHDFPFLQEKTKNISNILSTIKIFLDQTKYLDPDLMEELLFFLKGAFLDLSKHVDEIAEKDLEVLKNNHWQKILFLNDWVNEFLRLPERQTQGIKEKFEKYLIFDLGKDRFSLLMQLFVEMLLVEKKEDIVGGFIQFNQKKIPLINRKILFGDHPDNFPKKILIFNQNDSPMALEVDQVVNFLDLNIKKFFPVEMITGERYQGPIEYITILDNQPIFVLNPQTRALRPLTI